MVKYFIDTDIFLRTLVKEDEKIFEDCCQTLAAIKLNKIKGVTSNLVLAEIAWTLSAYYGFSKTDVVKALRSIINLRGLRLIDSFNPVLALSLYEDYNIKYIDAVLASIRPLYEKEWTIISYDKDFDKLNMKRKEPAEVLNHA
ncbi:PIN domain-containing protein [Candidatus Daviesbacteria bacterium]|nr:PIN domain-containing protein [Candidatus Daviesbacteria bacterium]